MLFFSASNSLLLMTCAQWKRRRRFRKESREGGEGDLRPLYLRFCLFPIRRSGRLFSASVSALPCEAHISVMYSIAILTLRLSNIPPRASAGIIIFALPSSSHPAFLSLPFSLSLSLSLVFIFIYRSPI
jgi:hypothetical protein